MDLKNKRNLKIILVISIISFSILIVALNIINANCSYDKCKPEIIDPLEPTGSDDFDILEFWETEYDRVNNTDLNIEWVNNLTIIITDPRNKKEYEFAAEEIEFDSPNWVGATKNTITLHGYLLYPKKAKSKNPGSLAMHGLNGNANASFGLALPYLLEGFIVLCHDHPGHGESEGALPTPSNWLFDGEYNEEAHGYLTTCGAIQALRVLETHHRVDNTSIMVTGGSYGALNTMWLSGIVGAPRIKGAIPFVAVGDLEKTVEDPTKLLFWVFGVKAKDIPDSFWDEENLRVDPKYYLKSPTLPPIMWQVGTTDEFFHRHSINGTIDAVQHDDAYLQIFPNGHHGFPNFEDNVEFFIDYVLNGGPAPPDIDVKPHKKETNLLGNILKIEVEVDSDVEIESVQVCYKYLGILGTVWEVADLEETDDDTWTGIIKPGVITSKVEYFIIVNLEGGEYLWFTSKIYTPGVLISNFTIPFYIIIVALIAIPATYLIWRRYKKNYREIDPKKQQEAKKYLTIELGIIGITEALFFISLILPWAIFEGGSVVWTHIYIFNNLLTYELLFGPMARYYTAAFFIYWITISLLSIMKPMLAGFFKIGYPLFVVSVILILTGALTDPTGTGAAFGKAYIGFGVILMLICSIMPFILGIWKRKYQTKLGIRQVKTKWYNIDRWFRIKNPKRMEEK